MVGVGDGKPLPVIADNDQFSDLQERMDRPNAWAYVAVDDNEVAGFALALGYPRTDESTSATMADTEYLSLLTVEPNSWGKGIASGLLDLVAERARNSGRSRLTLRTRDADNNHARSIYEHKGFVLTGATKDSQYDRQVEYQLDL